MISGKITPALITATSFVAAVSIYELIKKIFNLDIKY